MIYVVLKYQRTEYLRISSTICFISSRRKWSGWRTCGLCVGIRRSSIQMLPGDFSTSLPLAPNRSSKTLWYSLNAVSRGENVMGLNRSWILLEKQGGRKQWGNEGQTYGGTSTLHHSNLQKTQVLNTSLRRSSHCRFAISPSHTRWW